MTDDEKPLSRIEGECFSERQDLRGVRNEPVSVAAKRADKQPRYFCHVNGYQDGTRFLRVNIDGSVTGVREDWSEWKSDNYTLKECVKRVNEGIWKEINSVEAHSAPTTAQLLNSIENLLSVCAVEDFQTDHDQSWNFAYGHAAVIARHFGVKVFDDAPKELAASRPGEPWQPIWKPMETIPESGQVIVCWSDRRSFDTIGRDEYLEIIGYGETPALGWCALPAPPKDADQ